MFGRILKAAAFFAVGATAEARTGKEKEATTTTLKVSMMYNDDALQFQIQAPSSERAQKIANSIKAPPTSADDGNRWCDDFMTFVKSVMNEPNVEWSDPNAASRRIKELMEDPASGCDDDDRKGLAEFTEEIDDRDTTCCDIVWVIAIVVCVIIILAILIACACMGDEKEQAADEEEQEEGEAENAEDAP